MAQKKTNTQDGKHRVSKTLWTVYCFFLAASIFIIGRIIFLQYAWEPDQKTLKYFTPENRQETINPERGTITYCNGQILAISTPLYTIHMDCHILKKDLLKGKVKVGRDSISERDWRKMAMDMCSQLPAIIQD